MFICKTINHSIVMWSNDVYLQNLLADYLVCALSPVKHKGICQGFLFAQQSVILWLCNEMMLLAKQSVIQWLSNEIVFICNTNTHTHTHTHTQKHTHTHTPSTMGFTNLLYLWKQVQATETSLNVEKPSKGHLNDYAYFQRYDLNSIWECKYRQRLQ